VERPAWTLDRIQQLVRDKVREDVRLDYKESHSLDFQSPSHGHKHKDDFLVDVSSLANAGGGTLIYGVVEAKGGVPEKLDDGIDTSTLSIQRLEQIIYSNLQPAFGDVAIHLVPLETGRSLVVIEVAQSTALAPHQAPDKKYHQRVGNKNEPMADYQVRDVMQRGSVPDIRCLVQIGEPKPTDLGWPLTNITDLEMKCRFLLENQSLEPATTAQLRLGIDARLEPSLGPVHPAHRLVDGKEYSLSNWSRMLRDGPDAKMPLFRGSPWFALEWRTKIEQRYRHGVWDFLIAWEVLSPRMQPRAGYDIWHIEKSYLTVSSTIFTGSESLLSG
jgi:hypothetical protein